VVQTEERFLADPIVFFFLRLAIAAVMALAFAALLVLVFRLAFP
jgi:hypothetical protein